MATFDHTQLFETEFKAELKALSKNLDLYKIPHIFRVVAKETEIGFRTLLIASHHKNHTADWLQTILAFHTGYEEGTSTEETYATLGMGMLLHVFPVDCPPFNINADFDPLRAHIHDLHERMSAAHIPHALVVLYELEEDGTTGQLVAFNSEDCDEGLLQILIHLFEDDDIDCIEDVFNLCDHFFSGMKKPNAQTTAN